MFIIFVDRNYYYYYSTDTFILAMVVAVKSSERHTRTFFRVARRWRFCSRITRRRQKPRDRTSRRRRRHFFPRSAGSTSRTRLRCTTRAGRTAPARAWRCASVDRVSRATCGKLGSAKNRNRLNGENLKRTTEIA